MRSLHKIAAALVVLPLVAACSVFSTPSHTTNVADGTHQGRLQRLTYVNPLPGDPLWDSLGTCLTSQGAKSGISVKVVGPPGGDVDPQAMQTEISQAIANKAQAIVTWSGLTESAFDALFKQARQDGILTATVLSQGFTKNQNLSIDLTRAQQAKLDADAIAARPGPQRLVVIVQEVTGTGYSTYTQMLKADLAHDSNVTLLSIQANHGQFSADAALTSRILNQYPTVNVIDNYSGFPGVPSGIQEAGLTGKVALYQSADFPSQALQLFKQGTLTRVRAVWPCQWASEILTNFQKAWAGHSIPANVSPTWRFVDQATFRQLMKQGWV
jgi:ABC-type sugar transport system substrate-binding protein